MSTNNIQIADKALLVNLSVKGIWSAVVRDDEVAREIAEQHGVLDPRVGQYRKRLLDPKKIPALANVRQAVSSLREFHYRLTLPWNDDGTRLLAAGAYFEYTSGVTERKTALQVAYDKLLAELPALRRQAARELNGLFRDEDWPEPERLREKLHVRTKVFPLADPTDIRVSLTQMEVENIKREATASVFSALNGALLDVYVRLRTCIEDMVKRIAAYETDSDGKVVKTFRDTAITNLRELVAMVPKLNVTGDPALNQLAQTIEALLCRREPEVLRDDVIQRRDHLAKAQATVEQLRKMEEILGAGV